MSAKLMQKNASAVDHALVNVRLLLFLKSKQFIGKQVFAEAETCFFKW